MAEPTPDSLGNCGLCGEQVRLGDMPQHLRDHGIDPDIIERATIIGVPLQHDETDIQEPPEAGVAEVIDAFFGKMDSIIRDCEQGDDEDRARAERMKWMRPRLRGVALAEPQKFAESLEVAFSDPERVFGDGPPEFPPDFPDHLRPS